MSDGIHFGPIMGRIMLRPEVLVLVKMLIFGFWFAMTCGFVVGTNGSEIHAALRRYP